VYDLTLNISQQNYTGVIVPQTHKVRISVPEGNEAKVFEAGHQYNVILTVYGLEEVRVSVELTPWVDSDEPIIIDPDKKD
ncbi:MAG: fimbrillin family protein, partial [Bacteroidales bacterium]|nr:fimbrillin family protein [Bacteroidales bacterium]